MVRKLALAVLFALGGLPLSVYGIGLGDLKTSSALNQNFKGEIRLLSVPRGELDTMRVKLASREAFAKVGSEYAPVLNRLKFEPVRRKDGSAVILVTSREVIREPFLDFLVEVNWPSGRLVKEYTVLLDPPVTTKRRPAEISKPKIGTKKKVATSASVPVKGAGTQAKPPTFPVDAGSYGPVIANETAWSIAEKLRPEGTSIHETMMALQHANPNAFVNNNVNLLKKDSMLRVPSIEEIKALDGQDAIASFEWQTDDWQANVPKTAAAPATVGSSPEEGTAIPQPESQPEEVEEDGARLQIAAERSKDGGEAAAGETDASPKDGDEDLRHELMLARENLETSRLQAEEFKATVGQMDGQLEDIKRLLTLQDEQLAQLRARVAAIGDDPAVAEDNLQGALLVETQIEPDATPDQDLDQEAGESDATSEPEPAEDAAVAGTEAEAITAAEEPVELETSTAAEESVESETSTAAEEPVELETGIAAVEPVMPASSNAAEEPVESETSTEADNRVEEAADSSWQTSWLEDNLPMIAAAAGGLFGVGVLTALVRGRKKQPLLAGVAQTHDVMLDGSSDLKIEIGSQSKEDQEEPSSEGEHIGMDVPALEEYETEVDTLAAVDVYIAYARYDQAQKTLEEEIAGGDKSVPIRHKLLEVYFATDNVQNFVELADSMVKDGQDKEDTQAWEHIQDMGKELDRFNPLFWPSDPATITLEDSELGQDLNSGDKERDDSVLMDELETLDLDLASFSLQGDSQSDESEAGTAAVETELDTELADLSELDGVTQTKAEESADESDEEIRFAEPLEDIEIGDDMDTKLDLARSYMEMEDGETAMSILEDVLEKGSGEQRVSASELLSRLAS